MLGRIKRFTSRCCKIPLFPILIRRRTITLSELANLILIRISYPEDEMVTQLAEKKGGGGVPLVISSLDEY